VQYLRTTLGFKDSSSPTRSRRAPSRAAPGRTGGVGEALAAGDDLILFGSPSSVAASLTLADKISAAIVNAVTGGTLPQSTADRRRGSRPGGAQSTDVFRRDDDDVTLRDSAAVLRCFSTDPTNLFFESVISSRKEEMISSSSSRVASVGVML